VGQNENYIVPQSILTCIANKIMRSNELIWLQNHAEEFTFSCCDTWDKGWFFYMLWNNRTFKKIIYCKGRRDEMKLPFNPPVIHPVIRPVHPSRHGLFTLMGRRKPWSTDAADAQTRFRQWVCVARLDLGRIAEKTLLSA